MKLIIAMHALLIFLSLGLGVSCSTTEIKPMPPLPEAPHYLAVPHPEGYDLSDLQVLFKTPQAPQRGTLKDCENEVSQLKKLTKSDFEIKTGIEELVMEKPVQYHWCFYHSLLRLREDLPNATYLSERQDRVLDTYLFLTPVAHAFKEKFNDSRYLRLSIRHYMLLSQWVFNRQLEMTPQMTTDLLIDSVTNPFARYRQGTQTSKSVLEKYGLRKSRSPAQEQIENVAPEPEFSEPSSSLEENEREVESESPPPSESVSDPLIESSDPELDLE